MRTVETPPWIVGGVVALVVALLSAAELPALEGMEAQATDLLFRYGRPDPPEPSDEIVHVDVDDGSLDTFGRWPWPRSLLAEAVRSLDRFGPKVVAVDMLFTDPSEDDALLAEALAETRAKVILAVTLERVRTQLGSLWQGEKGARLWDAIQAELRRDITLSADDLTRRLGLGTGRAQRVRDKLREMKRVAIRRVAEELLASGRLTLPALRRALLPPGSEDLANFPELTLIRAEAMRAEATAVIEARLPDAQPGVAYEEADWISPPLPAFARTARGVGAVTATPDPDGKMRSVVLRWNRGGKIYPQFGAAAAAAWLDLPLSALAAPLVEFGARDTHIHRGEKRLLLAWPRIDPERRALGFARHIPLGLVIDLGRKERALAAQQAEHAEETRVLVADALAGEYAPEDLDDPARAPEVREELVLTLQDWYGDGSEPGAGEGEEAAKKYWAARRWFNREREIGRARREIAPARRFLRAALGGKLVFVGWNAEGNFGDFFPTVAHERTPGVVAHAVVANSLLTGYLVSPAPPGLAALVSVLLGLAAALATARTGPRLAFLLALLVATLYVSVNTLLVFNELQVTLAMAAPLFAIGGAWSGTTVMRAVQERRERRRLERQFGARISPQLFDFLLEHPDQVHLEGEEREVTCFFSDLAGFTAISEALDSRATVMLLNRYMSEMNDELTKLYAYVNKFLGDGIMAVWGAFRSGTPHAERACRAALGCMARLKRFNASPDLEGLPKLSMRIGIATGVVTVGDCGAPPALRDYTVIGDAANLAARLESANKQFGTRILINGRTKDLLSDEILTRPLGRITVVGQKTPTEIHEVLALHAEATEEQVELAERTARAVEFFAARRFGEARAAWSELLPSPLAALYLREIERADESFDGVVHLASK